MLVMFSTLNEKHIPDRMVKLIYGAFTVSAAVGVFVLALLRPAPGERAIAEGTKGSTTRISALETLSKHNATRFYLRYYSMAEKFVLK